MFAPREPNMGVCFEDIDGQMFVFCGRRRIPTPARTGFEEFVLLAGLPTLEQLTEGNPPVAFFEVDAAVFEKEFTSLNRLYPGLNPFN